MTTYRITAPNGQTYQIEGPPGASDADVARAVMAQFPESAKAAPPPEEGVLRQAADVPVSIARGAAMGVRMVADAFGANNPVSNSIKGVEDYLGGLLSAQAKQDEQEVARIMKDAEDKGVLEQVKAGFKAFATAPVDLLAQGLGTAAPAIVGGLGATLLRVGATGARAVGAGIGAGMGSGAVKGQIYEGVKEALAETGMSPEQVEARAQLAQSYGGENLDMILTGAALGGLASATGIEPILARQAAKSIVGRSIAGRAATTGVAEAVPEIAQGSQEQLAQNIALQREGFDVDTMRGVVGAGTLEGLAGAGLGAAVGAASPARAASEEAPRAEPELAEPVTPVAPAAPEVVTDETPAQATARQIAELEEDFPPLTRPALGPVPAEVEQAPEPSAAVEQAPDEAVAPAATPSTGRVAPFGETKMPSRQASIEDEVILQNRDRSTEASIGQMQSIAAKPDYGRMGFSRDLANGAPVVFGGTVEPTRMGVQDVAIATDGRRIPTQYAVVEADEVLASNTVDGSTNDAYATSRDSIRAIAGNGRIAGIQAAYQRGNADNYKTELMADARLHGVDPAAIKSMKAPVLVRFMPRESITRDIGDVSNISTGLELSAAEKAKNDLQRVDIDSVEFSDAGNITDSSVMGFIQAMPATERGGLLDGNRPSAQAFDRLSAAVFAKAYDNDELIRIYSQSKDLEIRVIFSALAKAAPKMARLKGTGDFDIRNIVTDAAEIALTARRSEIPIARAAQQIDITADPDVYAMLEMFARNSRSAKNVARYLGNLADAAYEEATKPTQDVFGDIPKRSRADLLEQARKEDEQEAADKSLEEQGGRKPSQEDDVQAGAEPRRAKSTRQDQGEELELKPATPETFQAAEKRAAQAPKDLEADQIRRESEAGADQFRLEGGEGRQDLTGKLFQQEGNRVRFIHRTDTEPGKGQRAGFYPGTYAYEEGASAGPIPSKGGSKAFLGELNESEIYTLKDAEALKREAARAGFEYRQASGSSEVQYLKSQGFKAMRRGPEIVVFDAKDANFERENLTGSLQQQEGKPSKAQSIRANADKIAAMDQDKRENTELGDFPGSAEAYNLYEARKMLKKPSDKLKKVTTSNSFSLWQEWDFIANVDGELYGVTKDEDPDDVDNEEAFVYVYAPLDNPRNVISTVTSDVGDLFAQIRQDKKPAGDLQGSLFQQDSGVAGDEIIVDGKVRPMKNSKGQLIANTPEKLRNFWRYFGDSLVVDKKGRPIVVYHGTKAFDDYGDEEGEAIRQFAGLPNWFAEEPYTAGGYAGAEGAIYPAYLSIKNPLVISNFDMNDDADTAYALAKRLGVDIPSLYLAEDAKAYNVVSSPQFVEAAQNAGYDGIKVKEGDYNTYASFDPAQIKSATGNEGSYSDQSPNILESKEVGKGWDIDPAEQAMERELVGKSVDEIGQWVVDNAPNQFTKVIAQKVQARIKEMQRRGVNMKIEVLTGDRRPMSMYSARGALSYKFSKGKPADMLLQLNGAAVVNNQAGYPPGMRYITVLHEMLHMATTAQTAGLKADHPLIRELNDIRNKVVEEFNKRVKAGKLSDFESRIYNRTINALADADEVLAWGLTDADMQKFMASIKVGEKTLFDKFVELMRRTFGLDVNYESAMDRLVKTSDQLLDMSIDEVAQGIEQRGYMFGPAQPRLQTGDTMQGELFSAQQPPIKPLAGKRRLNVYNQTPLSQWNTPDETKMADFVYTMQDKLVDTKDVVKAIEEQVGKIEEQWNPYLQEELYHGRTAKQTNDFLSDEMRPLVKMMDRMGVTIDELDTYLHNRIAEQRNKQAAALNPALQDGGSGIMTADARAYLDGLTKEQKTKYEQLAKKVDEISRGTRKLLQDTGLESDKTIAAWEKENPNYVPLFREDVDYGVTKEVTTGLGFNTKGGTSKRFMGSQRKVVNILANIAMQRERAIVRSNKNRVAVATYGLAVKNPNPGFWLAVNPDAKNIDKVIDELMKMGLTEADARGVMQEPVQARIERKKNPKTGLMEEQIVYEVNPAARGKFDVFASRVDGQDRYVFFNGNDPRAARMVTALKNLDADSLGRAMGMAATITRYFAAINTQYNPIFGAVNFLRDMQGAAIQVSNTPLAGKRAEILAGAFPALKGIYTALRADTKGKTAPTSEYAVLWNEFQQEGGQTGFRDQFSRSDERADALQKELKKISEGKVKKAGRAIFDWLSDYNDAMENALRLSAYKAGLDKGLSKQEAASVAKNLTVNFNRKGQIGVQANALYAFFNAAVQGTARLIQTLGTVENGKFRLTKVGKTILGGGFLLGSFQALALAAAGFDEDEPPQFIRERNFIIPTFDGKYITIPMPLGYNVIPNTSRIITEFVLSGGKDPAKRVADITGAFLDMFNPIGNAGWSAQTLAPTIADPLVALTENKDWTGKPIAREDFSNLDPTPGYTRSKETASWFSKNLSEFLNLATGGTSYQPGVFSPTPDQIDYLIGVATGGVGRELLKLEQTVTGAVTGEEVPTFKIPLAGRFFGDTKAAASEANKFYTNLKELNQHENEIKGRRENREDAAGYIRENPEARLVKAAGRIERNVQALRKQRRALVEKGAPKEAVKRIENQITAQMKRLNDMVAKLEK